MKACSLPRTLAQSRFRLLSPSHQGGGGPGRHVRLPHTSYTHTHLLTCPHTLHRTASQPGARRRCNVTDGFKPPIAGCQCKRSHNQRPALSRHMLTPACVSFGCPLATNCLVRLHLLCSPLPFVVILSHTYASRPACASSSVSSDIPTYLVVLSIVLATSLRKCLSHSTIEATYTSHEPQPGV